jgi:hypothetical protein
MKGLMKSLPTNQNVSEDSASFREVERFVAQVNREAEEREERELEALDDSILGTDRHELRRLRDEIARRTGHGRDAIVPGG